MKVRTALLCALIAIAPTVRGVRAAETDGCGSFAFKDVADELGVSFKHETGAVGDKHLPETMGAGAAWLDFDGDGWLDLYLVQSGSFPPVAGPGSADTLFRNLDGQGFKRVPLATDSGTAGYGQGVVAADVDGDGDQDLLLTNYGPDRILLNSGTGSFADGSARSNLDLDGWSSSAAFADADGDGDLDLYVTRYLVFDPEGDIFCGDPTTGRKQYCDPSLFRGAKDKFFENTGSGVFVDTTLESGVAPADGRGLGVAFADLDGDLRPDIYVANDLTVNFLFANAGGRFEDLSLISGAALNRDGRAEAGMGVALGDFDGDLDPDLMVTNFDVETNTLYQNLGDHIFSDTSGPSGFGRPSFNRLAFGIVAADFDRDRDLDVYLANGHIFESPERDNVAYRQPDQLLAGDGRGAFTESRCAVLEERPTVARGLAAADFDNDGDPDLVVQENGGAARVLANQGQDGAWLGVRLIGRSPNTGAIGSRLVLTSRGDQQDRQVRWITAGDSYQSSSDTRALFGLGETAGRDLEVTWPDGRRLRLLAPPSDRYLVLPEN